MAEIVRWMSLHLTGRRRMVRPMATDASRSKSDSTLTVALLIYDGVDELDVLGPARVFWAVDQVRPYLADIPELRVRFVSEDGASVRGGHGVALSADASYENCETTVAVLVVPGGGDAGDRGRVVQQHRPETITFLRRASPKVLLSVCTGAFIAAGAGLFAGRRATTHWFNRTELEEFMQQRGEPFTLVPERVVDDGELVSTGGVTSGIDGALHVVDRMFGSGVAEATAAALETRTPSRHTQPVAR